MVPYRPTLVPPLCCSLPLSSRCPSHLSFPSALPLNQNGERYRRGEDLIDEVSRTHRPKRAATGNENLGDSYSTYTLTPCPYDIQMANLAGQGSGPWTGTDCRESRTLCVRSLRLMRSCTKFSTEPDEELTLSPLKGPRLWNSLPINQRQCRSLEQFKRLLKIFFV